MSRSFSQYSSVTLVAYKQIKHDIVFECIVRILHAALKKHSIKTANTFTK